MKFRYKVILVNLIILSIMLGFTGYLLVYRNFRQALTMELRNASSENNMVKASVEFELLDLLNSSSKKFEQDMGRVVKRVDSGMLLSGSTLYVMYGEEFVFSGDDKEDEIPAELIENALEAGDDSILGSDKNVGKKYMYHDTEDGHYLYISSPGYIQDSTLTIITKKDLKGVYDQLGENLKFLKIISVIVLCVSAIAIYIISLFMTRPLEKLSKVTSKISGGDYSVRADIKTDDEVGELAESFNTMAGSVEENVEELKTMVHRREQFVADFTHEMKTPMTAIIGYADSVRHLDMTDEERDMSLNYIYTEGKRLEMMSQKLFDLLYLKDSTVFMEEVDTVELGNETILHMKPMLDKKNITVKTDFEEAEINGDAELIKTVFINLLDNSRKASDDGSEIEFTGHIIEKDDEKLYEYIVKDNGIGMSEEDQKRVFDEFYMADKSRTRKEGGAGLGMSLVAIILEKHDAKIRIESEPGKGTTIYTTWKIVQIEE